MVVQTKPEAQKDIRDAFFDKLYNLAQNDKNIIFLTADMGAWSLNRFRKDLPEQFINVGISEQNLVSLAAGLALWGKRVFIYAIAPFITERCFEQIKIDLCAMGQPVTIIGAGPGLCYSNDGPTHQALEDVSALNALPGMTILNPCDQFSSEAAALLAYQSRGPVYVRLDKGILPTFYPMGNDFSRGMFPLKQGNDLLIIATGIMTSKAFDLSAELKKESVDAGILDIFRIKPLDNSQLIQAAKGVSAVITLEEHTHIGGIGSTVCTVLAEEQINVPVRVFSINSYSPLYGDREWMHQYHGLDIPTLSRNVLNWYHSLQDNRAPQIQDLSCDRFAGLFGIQTENLPEPCRNKITAADFTYHIVPDRENILLRATKALSEELKVSGTHRKPDWEKGWNESLESYIECNYDIQALIPKFVKKNEYIRFNGDYIMPSNPDFETAFVSVLRSFLFEKYFKGFTEIFEFGCGTGHNLLHLAEMFPDKKLYGLDWADSSCKLINLIAEKHRINLQGRHFDLFSPDFSIPVGPDSAIFTIGTLEQVGSGFEPFLSFLMNKKPGLCIHVETLYELYDQNSFFDYVAAKYLEKRGYLRGFLTKLKELESEGKITILDVRKTFGSFYHDGYSYVVWKPA